MSRLGTWADHIIIQSVANINNLRIHITESAPNFSESTVVSSVYAESGGNVRDIYIGHLDELHCVSTAPIVQSAQINHITSDTSKANSPNLQSNKTISKETASMKYLEKRKEYMKKYMKERRKDSKLKKKRNWKEKVV